LYLNISIVRRGGIQNDGVVFEASLRSFDTVERQDKGIKGKEASNCVLLRAFGFA